VPRSPAQDLAHREAGDRLAAAVVPDAMVEPQTDRLVESLLTQMFTRDTSMRELETNYPGMRDALGAGMKPVLIRHSARIMPSYRAELSALYQANLTTREARSAADFIASPVFVAFTRSAYANMDFKATVEAIGAERDISSADVRRDVHAAGVKSGAALSTADRAAIGALMGSPLGLKLRALNPQKLAIDTKWFNYTDPASEAEIEAAVVEAMIGHIALSDPETAEQLRAELAKPVQ
jgi:hypothetical protein